MEYTTLGDTGMTVSRLCLGTMSFGSGRTWTLDEEQSDEIIQRALDLGINFFDTANVYSQGESEEILGSSLAGHNRDRLVVSTKVYHPMDPENPNSSGLSRKTIQQELSNSLERLGMDTVDIYHAHSLDPETSVETTMRAFNEVIERGMARYLGASSVWAWEFSEALRVADTLGLEPFSVMQNHYNLAYREEERDVLPLCDKHDVGVIPYSPLARGYLTRPDDATAATTRGADEAVEYDHTYHEGGGRTINERVEELAEEKGVSMAQISLSWVLHQDWVDAPIIGVSSVEHLEDAVEALDVSLSGSELEYLEEPYEPSEIAGHDWPADITGHR
ncbi:aldo/keto reductase [Halorubrum sp. CBA1125]|uniref:aldo/keto reductase n=1 Tax=Halorubrum sp. CBA1125 TaxID=2668072 RepID=UPI0012E91C6B|nr:aldo/keto reductase [Halorubrum sp. CBA1125]MUW15250.1 aldo/keto reductase [Halorubrum sp. CBA1125]